MQSKLKERVRRTLKEIDDLIPSAKRHLMTEAQRCFGQVRQEISAITRERDAASSQLESQAMELARSTSTIHALERDKQVIESLAKELRKEVAELNLRLERVTEYLHNQTRIMHEFLPCILSKKIKRLVTAGKIDDATIKQFYMMSAIDIIFNTASVRVAEICCTRTGRKFIVHSGDWKRDDCFAVRIFSKSEYQQLAPHRTLGIPESQEDEER